MLTLGDLELAAMKATIALIDGCLDILAQAQNLTKEERDRKLVELSIRYLQSQSENGKAERPIAFLRKFLDGRSETEYIDLHLLLNEDKGVKKCVHDQIRNNVAQLEIFKKTGLDITYSGRFSRVAALGHGDNPTIYKVRYEKNRMRELLIDIPQNVFEKKDWVNATGGFNLSWELVDVRADKSAVFAKLWGKNLYRWHPEISRKSQRVHAALERLKAVGACEFVMEFRPCLISVTTGELHEIR